MSENKITLKIDSDKIPANEFKESVDAFLDLINSVAENICVGKKCIQQFISVEKGSAVLNSHIMPKDDECFEYPKLVTEAVTKGLECLEKEDGKIPEYFNNKTLGLARRIAKQKNIKIITNEQPELSLTNNTVTSINSLLNEKYCDIGSIEGIIKTITTTRGLKVTIYESINNNPVKCVSKDEKINNLLKNSPIIEKRVSVYGEIFYSKDGIPQKINITEFRILQDEGLPTWEDVRGILND